MTTRSTPSPAAKRAVGRPAVTREIGRRYTVYLLPSIAARLREVGAGSLSAGITAVAALSSAPPTA